jgi:hypothetical protein
MIFFSEPKNLIVYSQFIERTEKDSGNQQIEAEGLKDNPK